MAKCPHCGQQITSVDLEGTTIGNKVFGPLMAGRLAVCPNLQCRKVLGVIADPAAIAAEVAKVLQGKNR